jgi:F-type H+-transporting ATPase subunit a
VSLVLRVFLSLTVLVGAAWVNWRHVPHHTAPDPFMTLYAHMNPEKLLREPPGHGAEAGAHGAVEPGAAGASPWLFSLTLPNWLSVFDMDPDASGVQLVLTNLQLFQLAAVLLVLILFAGVPGHIRGGRGDAVARFCAGFALWVRDEMVVPNMGKETGNKLLPFFLCMFFFILFMNVLGLVPGSATATSSIFVTAALAAITLLSMVFGGMIVQGPIAFWKNLVPHVPLPLWPLMFVVELVGLMVKPFALTVRLFANMTGGHLVVLSFMGLIFFFAGMSPAIGYGVSPIAVGFGVFVMIIEIFVAMLQAYIFTLLSILFIQASIHPEH